MLKITSDGRKLGLDQRLINPLLPDDLGSKVNACINNIFRIWQDGADEKLTQLVFCDISTPKGMERTVQQPEPESSDAPKEDDEMPPLEPVDDLTELAGVSSNAAESNFNVYEDIRSKLIARGVPPEEIAFIHDANTEVKKKELFAKVRAGQVRVLLGSKRGVFRRKCERPEIVRNPVKSSTYGTTKGSEGEQFFRLLSERPRVRIAPGTPPKTPKLSGFRCFYFMK